MGLPGGGMKRIGEFAHALKPLVSIPFSSKRVKNSTILRTHAGQVMRCSKGRLGLVTGLKNLPWGESYVGVGLDGEPWSSREPTAVEWSEVVAYSEGLVEHATGGK